MSGIINIQFGQELSKERWLEAADALHEMVPHVAKLLMRINGDGMGKQDVEDFVNDMQLVEIATRYVAEFARDKCRFIAVPGKGGGKNENPDRG